MVFLFEISNDIENYYPSDNIFPSVFCWEEKKHAVHFFTQTLVLQHGNIASTNPSATNTPQGYIIKHRFSHGIRSPEKTIL